ncbi:homoserine dehydrogenase [Sediminitomix flava]|uniref:Homoserine dehydrogenase n=1 Tax=Sediminitomix flava TaxID=379075 RepID=A0A315ZBH6_SEDFL|nr:homoserine dehydrogenase [Sediminitomix flava]PWJ42509.1 homoserine dehydrogenase [Sediminitomix flava]
MTRDVKIGLFGFGCVGQGLYDVLNNSKNFRADISKIVVKNKDKERPLPSKYFSFDKDEVLKNPEINLITELIDDVDQAYDIVTNALKNGKNVVSANKKMIAENLEELVSLQKEYDTSLLYEASACASIPIIRTLEEYYDNELLYSVRGIFNGSSNFILSKMFNEGLEYQDVLKEAQDLGFAETDPTLDVGGFDAKYKLVIIICHSYGLFVDPKEIFNYGIQNLTAFDMQYAKEKGLKIKQIARVYKTPEDEVVGYVMPQFVKPTDDLYKVDNEYNGVVVEAAFSDKQFFKGKGAGGHPTGSAVLSDISANRYDYKYEYRKRKTDAFMRFTNDATLDVYFRYDKGVALDESKFIEINERYQGAENAFVIGKVNLADFKEDEYFHQKGTFAIELPVE